VNSSWVAPTVYLLGAGWFFATSIIFGVFVGRWADNATGWEPAFTLLGILLGLAVAAVGGYRMVKPLLERLGDESTGKG
jgi:F0F1-type ATP synthase assembly protein I